MIRPKFRARDSLFLLMVLAVATVYYFFFSQPAVRFGFSAEEQELSLRDRQGTTCVFPLSEIESIDLAEMDSYGVAVDGGESWQGALYGTWHCDALGDYEAFLSAKIPVCIILHSGGQTIAFNVENAETTRSLGEQLIAYRQRIS